MNDEILLINFDFDEWRSARSEGQAYRLLFPLA